ncbi:MAG TPA: GIY-YIG nuclease family protein [Bacteroidia bacterium]|nr:GIY-YIG nuclease family protein [Bacteroidia bacterium]
MDYVDKYFVYIIWSDKLKKYYVGSSSQPEKRLKEHNYGKANFTSKGIPWKLVYSEQYNSKKEAQERERRIKQMKSKKYIENLRNSLVEHPVEIGSVVPIDRDCQPQTK